MSKNKYLEQLPRKTTSLDEDLLLLEDADESYSQTKGDLLKEVNARIDNIGGGNVNSVNGQQGDVVLDTDDIDEGDDNLYFTPSRVTAIGDTRYVQPSVLSNYYIKSETDTLLSQKAALVHTHTLSQITDAGDLAAMSDLSAFSTSDLIEGSRLYHTSSRVDARIALQKGSINGVATLDGSGKIPTSQLPALAITSVFVVASQAAMVALAADEGDVAVRTDIGKSFIHTAGSTGTIADWQELLTPTDAVLSVNGFTGSVTLTTSNIAEGTNLYYTQSRFNTAFAAKNTDGLTQGSTNLYSQWSPAAGGINYAGGMVGIGTSSPNFMLHGISNNGSDANFYLQNISSGKAATFNVQANSNYVNFDMLNASGSPQDWKMGMFGDSSFKIVNNLNNAGALTFPLVINTSNQVTLLSLTNGLVKSTSGLLSNAAAGTDYIASVNKNSTLTGSGTSASALGINLSNANTWLVAQRFTTIGINRAASSNIGADIFIDGTTVTQGFRVEGGSATAQAAGAYVTGDANLRFAFRADGRIVWGDGISGADTNLYRTGVAMLNTDGSLTVGTFFNVTDGTANFNNSGTLSNVANFLTPNAGYVRFTNGRIYSASSQFQIRANSGTALTLGGNDSTSQMVLNSSGTVSFSSLSSGMVKSTSGVISNAVAGTDYAANLAGTFQYHRLIGTTNSRYYSSPSNGAALTNVSPPNNTLIALPLLVGKSAIIDTMTISLEAAATGGLIELGIYADNGNCYPGTLVYDSGSFSGAAGLGTKGGTAPNIAVTPGLYWMVFEASTTSGTVSVRGHNSNSLLPFLGSASTINAGSTNNVGWSVAYTFAALPSTFPSSAGTISTSAQQPYMQVRFV